MDKEEGNEIGMAEFVKIDKSMGEKRSHQIAGGILLIALVLFAIYWDEIRVIFAG